jgi:hypothetical protein
MGHWLAWGVPSEYGATDWLNPCQCYNGYHSQHISSQWCVDCHLYTYYCRVVLLEIIVYPDPSRLVFS